MREREPIAIVGIGCRFPGSNGPAGFWDTLRSGRDLTGPIPKERWDVDEFFHADPAKPGKMVARTGAFLDDIAAFDWRALRVSPREAKFMDPQHRLLLEVAWEAFEDAGMPLEKIAGTRTAVFVGIMWNDYGKLQARDLDRIDGYSASGNAFAFAANRISFFFDLRGPSVALDVSCASSLMAVHLACESIWSGESAMGVAGGVNLIISPDSVIAMSKAGILSPEGHCKPFDASADGFVRGEGGGLVVLKPVSAALADGDHVYCVIRGSAAMHSGKTEWIMAPSRTAQEEVYREAYRRAGVEPRDVDYVELHGTGTRKGDPLEALSVANVIGAGSGRTRPCIVGSVKTNIGHLDSAAGAAGLIKTALCLEHREIPASLHLHRLNPEIDLGLLGLDFRTQHGTWPENDGPLRAGVTGLSFGGGNIHVVLETAPQTAPPATSPAPPPTRESDTKARGPWLLPLSARSNGALTALARAYVDLLAADGPVDDVSAAASVRRSHHTHRAAVAGRTNRELLAGLETFLRGGASSTSVHGVAASLRIAFVFSGQGPQWWAMGRELLEREEVFRAAIERCEEAMRPHADFSLLDELGKDEKHSRVHETRFAQPMLFALHVALHALLRSWGVEPQALVGHSVGEIAAACVGGALSLEDAARVAVHRGRIMHAASGLGRMIQVALSREEAEALVLPFGNRLGVAAHNGLRRTVISGEVDAVEEAKDLLQRRGVTVTSLRVPYAFHSAVMDRFQDELARALDGIQPKKPAVPIASTLFGRLCAEREAFSPLYWARQMREPVDFFGAVGALGKEGFDTFVEIGPHPVLASAIAESLGDKRGHARVLPSLVRGEPERLQLLSLLGALYAHGLDVAWPAVVSGASGWARLPMYPWQRERLWIDAPHVGAPEQKADRGLESPHPAEASHPLLDMSARLAKPQGGHLWEVVLDPERISYLGDHRVGGRAVVPASLFVEMAIAAADELFGSPACVLRDVELVRALVLPEAEPIRLQLLMVPHLDGSMLLEFFSHEERPGASNWVVHVTAVLDQASTEVTRERMEQPRNGAGERGADAYARLRRSGEGYGPAFQGISRVWHPSSTSIVAEVSAPPAIARELPRYFFHPALLDACMHAMALAEVHEGEGGFMPTRFARISVIGRGSGRLFTHVAITPGGGGDGARGGTGVSEAAIRVFDGRGEPIMEIAGARLQYLDELRPAAPEPYGDAGCCYEVKWRPIEPGASAKDDRSARGHWVLVRDGVGIADALGKLLERAGHSVTLVHHRVDQARTVATLLGRKGRPFRGIVHLSTIAQKRGEPAVPAAESSRRASLSIVEILQSVAAQGPDKRPPLFLVTRGAQQVFAESIDPVQALVWGLGRSIAAEHPELWGGIIDLDPSSGVPEAAARLFLHLTSKSLEDQVALRPSGSFAARLSRIDAGTNTKPMRLSANGSYLVTGGFGALGQVFARWLVSRGAKHLVLLGRSKPTARHAAATAELEALGGRVHHATADIADERQVRAALERLQRAGMPGVRGVLHAAGVVSLKPLVQLKAPDLDAMFQAKVLGAAALDRIFERTALDFFVLFSSASSILSSPSLAAYAAANAFLDALAHARRARGQHALSVNWGPWANEGMAVERGKGRGPLALRGMGAIQPELGQALLEDFVGRDLVQASVLPIAWARWRAAYPAFSNSPFLSEVLGAAGDDDAPAADGEGRTDRSGVFKASTPINRKVDMERYLLERIAAALHVPVDDLDVDTSLIDLGLDSLMLVELRRKIEGELGIGIQLMDLLSDPSIRQLSASLENRIGETG